MSARRTKVWEIHCRVVGPEHKGIGAEEMAKALARLVGIIQSHGRMYPGLLHAPDLWCDCGYCEARALLKDWREGR